MHHAQVRRKENIDIVVKTIAKTMPQGIEDKKLRAFLGVTYGFSKEKIGEYLENLMELGTVEEVEHTWRLVA